RTYLSLAFSCWCLTPFDYSDTYSQISGKVLVQEGDGSLPCQLGRFRAVFGPVGLDEPVPGVGISVKVWCMPRVLHLSFERAYAISRLILVVRGPVTLQWRRSILVIVCIHLACPVKYYHSGYFGSQRSEPRDVVRAHREANRAN